MTTAKTRVCTADETGYSDTVSIDYATAVHFAVGLPAEGVDFVIAQSVLYKGTDIHTVILFCIKIRITVLHTSYSAIQFFTFIYAKPFSTVSSLQARSIINKN